MSSLRVTSPDRTRICGSKVRTGCKTCKARHVKCDEARPECRRCVKAGKICDGYAPERPATKPRRDISFVIYDPGVQGVHHALELHERRSIDYFQNRTAIEFAGGFSPTLWTRVVMRMASHVPAVERAVIAIGSMHEQFVKLGRPQPPPSLVLQNPPLMSDYSQHAMQQYSKAIKYTMDLIASKPKDSSVAVLVTSVLFSQIEALQGHYESSVNHIASGTEVLTAYESSKLRGISTREEDDEAIEALRLFFIGMGTQIMSITESGQDHAGLNLPELINLGMIHEQDFSTLEDAVTAIAIMMNELMRTKTSLEGLFQGEPDMAQIQDYLMGLYRQMRAKAESFDRAFNRFLTQNWQLAGSMGVTIVQFNQIVVQLILMTPLGPDQTGFDAFLPEFERMLDLATMVMSVTPSRRSSSAAPSAVSQGEHSPSPPSPLLNVATCYEPTYTPTLGILPGLFLTASRCRDPDLRRRALSILRCCNRRESIWDSHLVAKVAEEIINTEEDAAKEYWKFRRPAAPYLTPGSDAEDEIVISNASDVPECCRVTDLNPHPSGEKRPRVAFHDPQSHPVKSEDSDWQYSLYG